MTPQNDENINGIDPQNERYVHGSIYLDPFIRSFLLKIPKKVAATFSEAQLLQIKIQFGTRTKAKHVIDVRSVMGAGEWRYYLVLLLGRNRRDLSRAQRKWRRSGTFLFYVFCLFFSLSAVFVSLYLIKSFLGIDIFPNYSLGLWSWITS